MTVSPTSRDPGPMTTNRTLHRGTLHRDGRTIGVHELTPDAPAGAPVVLLAHAAPGSGCFDPDPAATAAAGVRLIALDRPGYGDSDPVADGFTTVVLLADDAAAVLDELLPAGHTAGVAGWSAGGRVALALAARRPDLVRRVAVIGTPAPDEQVPWYGENRAYTDALRGVPAAEAQAAMTEVFAPMLAATTGDARFALLTDPDVDAAVLAGAGVAERLRVMLDGAFARGAAGMVADVAGYTLAPWGFEPSAVRAEVLLGYGERDEPVGPAHGQWWQEALPHARLEVVGGVGHLVVVPFWGRALAHLTAGG